MKYETMTNSLQFNRNKNQERNRYSRSRIYTKFICWNLIREKESMRVTSRLYDRRYISKIIVTKGTYTILSIIYSRKGSMTDRL